MGGYKKMEQYQIVYAALKKMNISYELVEHPPALTTEEADSYIEGKEGVRTKTLFLCNRKKRAYYLVIMDDAKRLDMKKLGELIGEKGMQFGSTEKLMEKMLLPPGVVSLFGLLNNTEHDIKIFLDKEMLSEKFMSFHANDNSKTIFISTDYLLQELFVQSCKIKIPIIASTISSILQRHFTGRNNKIHRFADIIITLGFIRPVMQWRGTPPLHYRAASPKFAALCA
jgi:Ala-tRNA(Pro) deacylase